MCFALDAQPPIAAQPQSYVRGEDLVLASLDGTRFQAYAGHVDAVRAEGAGIVILPDVRGLFSFYRELALRFAEAGVESVAIDYFGRTAGLTPRDESFDHMAHVAQTRTENIMQDVASAVAYLRRQTGGPRAIFTVGFCFGGQQSFLQAAHRHKLAGVIGFYGMPHSTTRDGAPGPTARAAEFACPVLGLFGGADPAIPAESIQHFDEALTAANVPHELIVYPGAPHSFFDRKQEQFANDSADAWQRTLAFIAAQTPSQ